jgi:hypothetical protein
MLESSASEKYSVESETFESESESWKSCGVSSSSLSDKMLKCYRVTFASI